MTDLKEKLEKELSKLTNEPETTKGAACFKSIGFASCSDGISEEQARKIANRLNVSYTFHPNQSCNQITCKP